eukprot:1790134-Rhodomonas_salina.2
MRADAIVCVVVVFGCAVLVLVVSECRQPCVLFCLCPGLSERVRGGQVEGSNRGGPRAICLGVSGRGDGYATSGTVSTTSTVSSWYCMLVLTWVVRHGRGALVLQCEYALALHALVLCCQCSYCVLVYCAACARTDGRVRCYQLNARHAVA